MKALCQKNKKYMNVPFAEIFQAEGANILKVTTLKDAL